MKSLQKIGVLTWAFYFLLTTTGISLSYLYCYCSDAEYFALFSEIDHKCDKHQPKKEATSCCAKLLKKCEKPTLEPLHNDKDCCDANIKFVKADIDVIHSQKWVKYLDFSAVAILPTFTVSNTYHHQNDVLKKPNYRPPPQRHGIELRHFIQSYLC